MTTKKITKFVQTNWIVLLLFVVAVVARLVFLRLTITIGVDSIDHMNFAKDMFSRHGYLWHGPQLRSAICEGREIVAFLGPFYVYLWAIPAAVSKWNFLLPSAFQALIGCLAVILYYVLALRVTKNIIAAAIVGVLMTFSTALIIADRTLWNPNVLPFFVAGSFVCFLELIKGRKWYLLPFAVFISLSSQLHASSWLFIPGFVVLWAIYKIKIKQWSIWLYSILLLIVSYLPLVIHEIINRAENSRDLYDLLFKLKSCAGKAIPFIDSVKRTKDVFASSFWTTISGRMYEAPWGMWQDGALEKKFMYSLELVVLVLLIALFIELVFYNKSKKYDLMWIPLVGSFVYICATVFYGNALYDYYFMTVIPLVYIVIAFYLGRLSKTIIGKSIVILIMGIFIFVNAGSFIKYIIARENRAEASHLINPDMIWQDKLDLVNFIKSDAEDATVEINYQLEVPIANRVFQYLLRQDGVLVGESKIVYIIVEPRTKIVDIESIDGQILFDKTFSTLRLIKVIKN